MNRTFFDEALAFDVRHAFLNPAEFGTPMNVDGLDTIGIWDDAVAPAEGGYESNVETWGVHQLSRTLAWCRPPGKGLSRSPAPGKTCGSTAPSGPSTMPWINTGSSGSTCTATGADMIDIRIDETDFDRAMQQLKGIPWAIQKAFCPGCFRGDGPYPIRPCPVPRFRGSAS